MGHPGARRPVVLIGLTVAVWLAVIAVVVVSYFLTRQPPWEPITVGG